MLPGLECLRVPPARLGIMHRALQLLYVPIVTQDPIPQIAWLLSALFVVLVCIVLPMLVPLQVVVPLVRWVYIRLVRASQVAKSVIWEHTIASPMLQHACFVKQVHLPAMVVSVPVWHAPLGHIALPWVVQALVYLATQGVMPAHLPAKDACNAQQARFQECVAKVPVSCVLWGRTVLIPIVLFARAVPMDTIQQRRAGLSALSVLQEVCHPMPNTSPVVLGDAMSGTTT